VFVFTDARLAAPVPVNVIVLPAIPAPDAALSVSLPVTVKVVLQGTEVIVFSARVVVWDVVAVDVGFVGTPSFVLEAIED
jgi:hypothetical protein